MELVILIVQMIDKKQQQPIIMFAVSGVLLFIVVFIISYMAYSEQNEQVATTAQINEELAAEPEVEQLVTTTEIISPVADTSTTSSSQVINTIFSDFAAAPPPPVPKTTELTNNQLALSLTVPEIFQYGLSKSEKGTAMQFATYSLNTYYDTVAPPGIKIEIQREERDGGKKLITFAAESESMDSEEVLFDDATIDGHKALTRYTQENSVVSHSWYFRTSGHFYIVYLFANREDYQKYEDAIMSIVDSIKIVE